MYYHTSRFRNEPAQKLIIVEMVANSTTAVDCFSLEDLGNWSQENYICYDLLWGEMWVINIGWAPAEQMKQLGGRFISNIT